MADLAKIVDDLSKLTVLEAAELSKLLEEKWGVSAAAPVAVAAVGGTAGGAADGSDSHRSGSRNAPLLFEQLRQLGRLEDGQLRKVVYDLCEISHFSVPSKSSNRCC